MDSRIQHALLAVIAAGPASRFVAMFGSYARGSTHPGSDLDLAWEPVDADLPLAAELSLQADLTRAAECEVDLVRVDRTSTVCRMEIARDGILLAGDRGAFNHFRAEATIEYLDFAPALRDATRRYRRFLAAGAPRPAP